MLLDVRCPGCERPYLRLRTPICPECLDGFGPPADFSVPGVGIGVAAALHEGRPRRIILAGKVQGRSAVFSQLGQRLAISGLVAGGEGFVTWVPASPEKRRQRGYDQAEILAKAIARALRMKTVSVLSRNTGERQTGRNRQQRMVGPALTVRGEVPASLLLVDDVVTTGVSMGTAARLLRQGGAGHISALALTTRLVG